MLVGVSDELLRDVVDVAYRAAAGRQQLDVHVRYAGVPALPRPPWAMQTIAEAIACGAAAGADCDPSTAACAIVAGPTAIGDEAPGELAAAYEWTLDVEGLSTAWLPAIVEHLFAAGLPHATERVSIVGSLPLDRTPRSARSADVIAALRAPARRAGATATPGFAIDRRPIARGLALKASLHGEATPELAHAFAQALSGWQGAVLTYPNLALTGRGYMDPQLVTGRTRAELFARGTLFDHAPGLVADALVNTLARFHAKVARLARLELALP